MNLPTAPNLPPEAPIPTTVYFAPAAWKRVLLTLCLTFLADFLFWNYARLGVSVAIFEGGLALSILMAQGTKGISKQTWILTALLFGAIAQSAINLCLSNQLVVIALLIVLLGDTSIKGISSNWARWLQALFALPGLGNRWSWFFGACTLPNGTLSSRSQAGGRALMILLPAGILVLIFGSLLSSGNAIFSSLISNAWTLLTNWLSQFDFSIARALFWALMATIALACVAPHRICTWLVAPSRIAESWFRRDENLARLQTVSVLVALNVLFFAANTIDAIFLWFHGTIPAGVRPHDYIHQGANSVIAASILSAVVLTTLFMQYPAVSGGRLARALGLAWIIQNFVMIAGVFKRLELYVLEFHLLTEKRICLGLFLCLVSFGFVFLLMHVLRGPNLARLLQQNIAATFVLFYLVQFVNITGLSAHWNVAQWQRDHAWGLDVNYLCVQGPEAWSALVRAAATPGNDPTTVLAQQQTSLSAAQERVRLASANWRSWQGQRQKDAGLLIAQADRQAQQ